jgi:hypothetical protein
MDKSTLNRMYSRIRQIKDFKKSINEIVYDEIFKETKNGLVGDTFLINDHSYKGIVPKETFIHPSEAMRDVKEDLSVKYIWNSLAFRCEEFKKDHGNKQHVLFMGCSETVGIGGNLDECWAYILYNKLNKKFETSGYFNIAKAGSGVHQQIYKYFQYEKQYGKPNEIYMLVPETYRCFIVDKNTNVYWGIPISTIDDTFINQGTYLSTMFNAISELSSFEVYCKENEIKLFWSSLDEQQNDLFSILPFTNFVKFDWPDPNKQELDFFQYQGKHKYSDIKKNCLKRDGHFGYVYHEYWAEKLFEKRF